MSARKSRFMEQGTRGLGRREFLRLAGLSLTVPSVFGISGAASARRGEGLASGTRKVIVVTFGGGARDDETFSPEGQENIPHLVTELAPQSTFLTCVVNGGILGHYVATSSIATGAYETFDNFVSQHPAHPTLFEYFRKGLRRPAADAWVIAPSNGFDGLGSSAHSSYGSRYAAEVVLPKKLLAAATDGSTLRDYEDLLRDSYELPSDVLVHGDPNDVELGRLSSILKLKGDELLAQARLLASPDELSIMIAAKLMEEVAPSLIFITLHDMDVAHAGAYSLYLEGIRRSDRLCAELWDHVQNNPEYKGHTTMFVMPDFGRDADGDPGGNGFQHHRTGSALARTTWMMVLGPDIRPNHIVDQRVESVDLVPTIGRLLGFDTPFSTGKPIGDIAWPGNRRN
jgi:hypothetical protein